MMHMVGWELPNGTGLYIQEHLTRTFLGTLGGLVVAKREDFKTWQVLLECQKLSLAQEQPDKHPTLAYSLFNPACYGAPMLEAQHEKLSQLRYNPVFVPQLLAAGDISPLNLRTYPPVLWKSFFPTVHFL